MVYKLFSSAIFLLLIGCGQKSENLEVSTSTALPMEVTPLGDKITIDTTESIIRWTGTKKLGTSTTGSHSGIIHVQDGFLLSHEDILTGGSFTINMKSIEILDEMKTESKIKLLNHLYSDHFFESDKYEKGTFQIVEIAQADNSEYNYLIEGNLTLKDTTLSITFPAEIFEKDGKLIAEASLAIDRTRWKINYKNKGSVKDLAKDWFINDEIDLDIIMVANKE